MTSCCRKIGLRRRGTTAVEFAVILPILFTFIFGIIEYGRVQLVSNLLKTACRSGARYGATEGISTTDAQARVAQILGAAVDPSDADVVVKDAGVFDSGGTLPSTASEFAAPAALSDPGIDSL